MNPSRKHYIAHKAVLVNEQGKILLLKSSTPDKYGSAWDLPGGQMELGEEPLEALAREVKEEIGLAIDVSRAQLFHTMAASGFGEMAHERVIKNFYIAPMPAGDIVLSWEHSESIWLDPRQPLPEDLQGYVRSVVEAYIKFERISGRDDRILGKKGYGLVQLIYGNGKGKTTAALGQAIRAAGAGKRVKIIYFDKGGNTHYNERNLLDQIELIDYEPTGRDRIDPVTGRFDFSINETDKTEAARGLQIAKEALASGEHNLVILDEVNSTCALGMMNADDILDLIKNKHPETELILTGRNPHPAFLEAAHIITEMKLERHYFYSGVPAREGLDY